MKPSKSRGASLVEMLILLTLVALVAIPSVRALGKVTACRGCHSGSALKLGGYNWGTWDVFYPNCLANFSLYTTGYVCHVGAPPPP